MGRQIMSRAGLKAILKQLHLYHFACMVYQFLFSILDNEHYSVIQKRYERLLAKKVQSRVKEINRMIAGINMRGYKGILYILQHSYYDKKGEQYISGGGERYASDLAKVADRLGYRTVLIQMGEAGAKRAWKRKRENVFVIGVNGTTEEYLKIIELLTPPKLAIYSGFVYWGRKLLRPNIMISHGITWDNPQLDVDAAKIKKILERADEIVSVDTNTISWLRSSFSCYLEKHPKRMNYIPNYTDLDIYKPLPERGEKKEIRITFPRRCCPERGFWLVCEVLPEILEQYKEVTFEFIGFIHSDDIGEQVEQLKKRYPGRVTHRFVEADKMVEVYQQSDISLIPTLYCEGTSLSCIEAMACGNVVVATNVGGLPNLILDGYNGLLISPDKDDLLRALKKVLASRELQEKIKTNAVAVTKEFSKKQWEERWNAILLQHLSGME